MAQLKLEIPDELKSEFKRIPRIELSILVNRALKSQLSRIARFKKTVDKSRLSAADAESLADQISEPLAKRYKKLSRG